MAVAYRFKGTFVERKDDDGNLVERSPVEFLSPFPARDLTDEDLAVYSDEDKERLKASALYQEVKAGPPQPSRVAPPDEGNP